jgi:hypothetical protein
MADCSIASFFSACCAQPPVKMSNSSIVTHKFFMVKSITAKTVETPSGSMELLRKKLKGVKQ